MKRVLFIAQHFLEANMGALRMRRLARHLPAHGFEPIVLTRGGTIPAELASDKTLPALHQIESVNLTQLYRRLRARPAADARPPSGVRQQNVGLTSFLNRWFMIPDKQCTWRRPALAQAGVFIARHRPDVIFASLDPRTNLLVAATLGRRHGIPVVLEYRDLWTGSPYYHVAQPTPIHRAIHRRLERNALRAATRVTAVCRGIAEYLDREYARDLKRPAAIHHNFFDPSEYPPRRERPRDPFVVSYVGAMYFSRQPRAFFEGFRAWLDRRGLSPAQVRFVWLGSAYNLGDLDAHLDRLGLRPYLDIRGQVPHAEAMRQLVDSDLALIIQAPHDRIHIPGKLFEAMGARVPVLNLADPCEVTDIMDRTGCGLHVPHDPSAVADALDRMYQARAAGPAWPFVESEITRFEIGPAAGRFAELLEEAIAASPG